jgi:hypothetical protein
MVIMMMMMMTTINNNNQCLIGYTYLAGTERKIEDVLGEDQFEFRR